MKGVIKRYMIFFIVALALPAAAADDPSIQGDLRVNINSAMSRHVEQNTLDGEYIIYDAVDGKLLTLDFKELHSGITKKGEFYVSCADFTDDSGAPYDIDFLVAEKDGQLRVFQAVVHSANGNKRQYHVEGN